MNLTRLSIDARALVRACRNSMLCAATAAILAACGGDGDSAGNRAIAPSTTSDLRPIDAPAQNSPTTRCAP